MGEPREGQAAASEHPRQPDSSNQPFQRNSGESAWRGAWGPPGLSWLLLGARGCSWTSPGLSWQAWGGSDRPRLDHATVSCATRAGQSFVGPGVPGAVLAAPGEPGCCWSAPGLPEAAQKGSSNDPGRGTHLLHPKPGHPENKHLKCRSRKTCQHKLEGIRRKMHRCNHQLATITDQLALTIYSNRTNNKAQSKKI